MTGEVLLRARGLVKRFGDGDEQATVLHGVDCEVRAGQLSLLMGPSGSGKTTLVSILAGLMRPSEGEVELCGSLVTSMPDAAVGRVRREKLGFVFQGYNLFPALTARQNVALGFSMKGKAERESLALAGEALAKVGLGARADALPEHLSGGQKQRVAIARALAGDPPLVIGDEITAALDSPNAMAVMQLLRDRVTPGSAVLLVTHDHRLTRYADVVIEIEDGRVVREGPGEWQAARAGGAA